MWPLSLGVGGGGLSAVPLKKNFFAASVSQFVKMNKTYWTYSKINSHRIV